MNGYSDIGAIYFSIGDKTSFARYKTTTTTKDTKNIWQAQIETGTYPGTPPYRIIKGKLSIEAKKYHAAEHLVYNCFMHQIKNLSAESSLEELAKYVPTINAIRKTNSYSFFCGTTFLLSSSLIILVASMANYFKFSSSNYLIAAMIFIIAIPIALIASYMIQKKYFLHQPELKHLILARQALKEVLKNE
jgi:uncharacterized protein YqhQ